MVKRIGILILSVSMLFSFALADIAWKTDTSGQQMLKAYIESANTYLTAEGETPVNSLFEMYPAIAVMGITEAANAETPENIEITVTLLSDRINMLQLRVCEPDRFPLIAGALIRALYGENISAENAMKAPEELAAKAIKEPLNSYEEPVEELSGRIPRFYYAYYPNQYHDGRNWLQMTLIFPMDAAWNGTEMIIGDPEVKGVDPSSGVSEDYEGYFSRDDFTHYEFFTTPTPEPDSAASEYDFR